MHYQHWNIQTIPKSDDVHDADDVSVGCDLRCPCSGIEGIYAAIQVVCSNEAKLYAIYSRQIQYF